MVLRDGFYIVETAGEKEVFRFPQGYQQRGDGGLRPYPTKEDAISALHVIVEEGVPRGWRAEIRELRWERVYETERSL